MAELRSGTAEARFAELIWASEPIASGELAKKCETVFGWKKTTTYTVLKRLCDRGLFQNAGGTVTSLVSREEYAARQGQQVVEEQFGGSLPAFVAAFSSRKRLSKKELDELEALIREMRQ